MNINHVETKKRFDEAFSQAKIVRTMGGISGPLFSLVLSGKYEHMNGPRALKVVAKLRDLGVLVEEPDTEEKLVA